MKLDQRLRYGGYSTLVTAAAIAIVALVNLLAGRLPWRADMTFERFFTLSDLTQSVLDSLERPVTVLKLFEAGREDERVSELLMKYESRTSLIEIRQVDPYRNPVELRKYAQAGQPPGVGSLVFESGGRFRVLRPADMYELESDPYTGEMVPARFLGETVITNALASVTIARDPVVYLLRGHGERDLPPLLVERLRRAFYDLRDLTLATAGSVPEDATIVVAVSPRTDFVPAEEEALLSFLRRRGGRLLLMTDIGAEPQPNIGNLLESYGLSIQPWLVVEGAAEHMLPNQPYVLIPNVAGHPITAPNTAADFPILFPVSQAIEPLSAVRRTVTVQPLLASSSRSYAKVSLDDLSGDRGPGDPAGPFILAAAVTDSGEIGEQPNRLIVMASSHFVFPPETMGRLEENENLFLNSLAWLQDRPELLSIPPRVVVGSRYDLALTGAQFFLFGGVAVLLIPALVFGAALVTWLRRRHR